ncbi:enoyl-CoA hydratase/isomerase family protein [Bacillus sp. AK128]
MNQTSVVTTSSGIVIFKIHRPEVRNAINFQVMDDLHQIIDHVSEDSSCKALVITGEGDQSFCSGGDLSVFKELHTEEQAYAMLSKMGTILYKLMTLNKPTYALLNGIAIGGGLELATACDFRIARSTSKFGFVQGKLAITTGWGGGAFLFEKIPYDIAAELLFSATIYTATWGKSKGFIQHVLEGPDWEKEGVQWIEDMLLSSGASVLSAYKEIAIRKWQASQLEDRVFQEIKQCAKLWALEEHHEAVNRFLKKEKYSH